MYAIFLKRPDGKHQALAFNSDGEKQSAPFTIGSNHTNQLVLNDPSVAANHARILVKNDTLELTSLDSNNPCLVNHRKVQQHQLRAGDTITLGKFELEVTPTDVTKEDEWALVADGSWMKGQKIPLYSNEIIIGRDANCDITLPGSHLSRQHAQLGIWGGQLHVKDLNSANGTFINGRRITQGCAKPGDQIRFDIYSFQLHGPGMQKKRSNGQVAKTADYRDPDRPKHWKLSPTSPGNREEPAYANWRMHPMTWVSAGLCVVMLAILAYVFLS